MQKPKRKSIYFYLVVLFIGLAAFFAADRYFIRHVDIANVSASAESPAGLPAESSLPALATTGAGVTAGTASPAAETITADDWNYASPSLSIAIQQVTTGSGSNALTYFVADVVLSDAAQYTAMRRPAPVSPSTATAQCRSTMKPRPAPRRCWMPASSTPCPSDRP